VHHYEGLWLKVVEGRTVGKDGKLHMIDNDLGKESQETTITVADGRQLT